MLLYVVNYCLAPLICGPLSAGHDPGILCPDPPPASRVTGASSAMDALCSHAYAIGHYNQLGIFLQQGILVSLLACIPGLLASTYSAHILTALGRAWGGGGTGSGGLRHGLGGDEATGWGMRFAVRGVGVMHVWPTHPYIHTHT